MSGLALKLADKTFNGADATTVTSGFGPDRYEWNDSGLGWTHLQVISVSMTIKAAPGSPSGLKAAPKSSQTVELSWDDPGDESITKYQYRKSENGGVSWLPDWSDIASSDKDTNSHMVSGLTIGTEHTFSVRAVNDAGSGSAASITITPGEDLDDDDEGLIEVSNLAQLNAIRWDLDGDGSSSVAGYAAAFPTARTGMGCPESGCIGYELTTDLDFDTNGDGVVDSSDDYWNAGAGWEPIVQYVDAGEGESRVTYPFNATFDGGGHTVANLFINRTTDNIGLFGVTGSGSEVRNVGLPSANVTGNQGVGALVGRVDSGKISASFSTGSVTGTSNDVGGLVGRNNSGSIAVSYSTAAVSGDSNLGGLVGYTEEGAIKASYATGSASSTILTGGNVGGLVGNGGTGSVQASYTIGPVTGNFSDGLVGFKGATISNSYWNSETSQPVDSGQDETAKTTEQLQSPTAYGDDHDIYANWNVDVDGDDSPDDPWDFGTNQQYPAIKIDFNGDNDATWQEFGFQRAVAGFTVTAGNLQVTISWDDFGDPAVSHFEARQSEDGGDTWTTWETIPGSAATTTNHTLSGLTSGVTYTFQIRPVKGYGAGLASESITATPAAPNTSPRLVAPIADQTLTVDGSTTTFDLSSNFSDPDGNLLSYNASSSNPSVVTASTSGSQLTLTPVAAGTAAVTVDAVDPSGAGVSDQFSVTVSESAPDEEEEPPTTPEPTAPPTVPAPPPPTAQEILILFEENPEQAGEVVGQLADDDPEEAGRVISQSAEEDEQAAGQIICSAVDGHSASMGRAVGHAAKENAGSTSNALGTISDDGDCVGQLGSVIPVEPWLPEQPPPEGQDQTGQGTWQDVGSPAPVENLMARFFTPIEDAHTDITNLDEPPSGTEPLPPDNIPYAYVDIAHDNFTNDDIVTAHATISVEKEWLSSTQVHQWSVQLSRFDPATTAWIPTQSKRIGEDEEKVYYTVTVPGFSLWAIHGSTEPPALTFVEDNLQINRQPIGIGQFTVVSVDVTNTTDAPATYFANLWVDKQINQTRQILIGAGLTQTVSLPLSIDIAGAYQIRVGSQLSQQPLLVEDPAAPVTPVAQGDLATPTAAPPTVPPTIPAAPPVEPTPTIAPTIPPTPAPVASVPEPTSAPESEEAIVAQAPVIGSVEFSDPSPSPGDQVMVTIPITHLGPGESSFDLEIEVAGSIVGQQTVVVPPGETLRVEMPIIAPSDPSDVTVRVNGLAKQAAITPAASGNTGVIIGVVVAAVVILVIIVVIIAVIRRRR